MKDFLIPGKLLNERWQWSCRFHVYFREDDQRETCVCHELATTSRSPEARSQPTSPFLGRLEVNGQSSIPAKMRSTRHVLEMSSRVFSLMLCGRDLPIPFSACSYLFPQCQHWSLCRTIIELRLVGEHDMH